MSEQRPRTIEEVKARIEQIKVKHGKHVDVRTIRTGLNWSYNEWIRWSECGELPDPDLFQINS